AQRMASTTFDLPHPLGPTIEETPGEKVRTVRSTNDLNPWRSSCLIRIQPHHLHHGQGVFHRATVGVNAVGPEVSASPAPVRHSSKKHRPWRRTGTTRDSASD